METIGKREIRSFLSGQDTPIHATNTQIRHDAGHFVHSYLDLAKKIAELHFCNPQYVFLFRGQNKDYKNNKKNTSLKPSILRSKNGGSELPDDALLEKRFLRLANAEKLLVDNYGQNTNFEGGLKLQRQRVLRWAILQHYEICDTPLLDITQSLHVAGSFASEKPADQAYIFVLGVPQLNGSLTASAEAGLQIVRLSGICPPVALRPHIQEGYLLGEYPDMPDFVQKSLYPAYEVDFGRRLIAKFRFNPNTFWAKSEFFPNIHRSALYPDADDPLCDIAEKIKSQLPSKD